MRQAGCGGVFVNGLDDLISLHTSCLDYSLTKVNDMVLENRLIATYFPLAYVLAMKGNSFRDRVLRAVKSQGLSKAELSRRSGVPYHTLDKFMKGASASTSAENAQAIANALGVAMDGEEDYDEIRRLYFQLSEEQRAFVRATLRGLLSDKG